MDERPQVIGKAKMALVPSSGKAVISQIVVRRIKQQAGGKCLHFVGKVRFSRPVQQHMENIILPIIDRIVDTLDLARWNYEISARNLGAASARDVGIDVSGLSADVSLFIAILSEALQIPVSSDFIATGHIASADGDISAVEGIPAKVEAAQKDRSIGYFLYPDLDDESLKVLSPNQMDSSIKAIMAARDQLHTRAVRDIGQLVRLVITEESVVWAGLKEGFFRTSMIPDKSNNPIQDVISFLTCNNQERFWNVMYYLFNKEPEKGKELLDIFVQFFLSEKKYPKRFGAGLLHLMHSLSSGARCRIDFPILDRDLCTKLISYTKDSDYDDRRILLNVIDGENIEDTCPINIQPEFKLSDSECSVFNTIVSLINEQALARKFSAIDSARACFILESLKVKSYEELINILQTYYIHIQRYTGSSPEKPDISEARCETMKLLEETFRNEGGGKAALVRARDCTQGGIRSIIDMITEHYKAQKQDAYINRVFKDAIDDMDWKERIKCIQAVIKEVGRFLPEELKNQPPEKFARSDETIVLNTEHSESDNLNSISH
ncbi:hypothetical protein ACFL3Q_15450 [Planctomycetota bacterium]